MAGTHKRPRTWPNGMPRRQDNIYDRQLISVCTPSHGYDALPLVHVTPAGKARDIIKTSKIIAQPCEVFDIELIYFFVLRPAYASKFGEQRTHFLNYFPVAFVMKPEAVPRPYHVYPFDTGGGAKGAFRAHADRFIPLDDYALEPSHAAAARFIEWAFGTLERYYDGRVRPELDKNIHPDESVAVGYRSISKMGIVGSLDHDTRASTVEVASRENVDVPDHLRLIILPKQMIERDTEFKVGIDKLKANGTTIEVYDWQPNRAPSEFQRDIMRISREWYRGQGMAL